MFDLYRKVFTVVIVGFAYLNLCIRRTTSIWQNFNEFTYVEENNITTSTEYVPQIEQIFNIGIVHPIPPRLLDLKPVKNPYGKADFTDIASSETYRPDVYLYDRVRHWIVDNFFVHNIPNMVYNPEKSMAWRTERQLLHRGGKGIGQYAFVSVNDKLKK